MYIQILFLINLIRSCSFIYDSEGKVIHHSCSAETSTEEGQIVETTRALVQNPDQVQPTALPESAEEIAKTEPLTNKEETLKQPENKEAGEAVIEKSNQKV